MRDKYIAYIYRLKENVRCLTHDEALTDHDSLIKDGWEHTDTVECCRFIEYLLKNKV